jgi:signal transduction histidine kinase
VQLCEDVPAAVRETFYRIAQEALGNACRHSGAAEVEVEVRDVGGKVRLAQTLALSDLQPASPSSDFA